MIECTLGDEIFVLPRAVRFVLASILKSHSVERSSSEDSLRCEKEVEVASNFSADW